MSVTPAKARRAAPAEAKAAADAEKLFAEADFRGGGAVIAAVSGGGDSLALLFLLADYLRARGQKHRLAAITIDHALREESAQEAEFVGALCRKFGIRHETLRWEGQKPERRLQAEARAARYDLLAQAAEKYGAGVICAGHTLNDQAETYLMRRARLAGAEAETEFSAVRRRGLACMAREMLFCRRFLLLRPLLAVRRADLRAFLTARGVEWRDDPSNENGHYERVRIRRRLMADDERQGGEAARAAAQAAREAGRARLALSRKAALAAQKLHMRRCDEGGAPVFSFDLTALQAGAEADGAALYLLLALSAAICAGKAHISPGNARLKHFIGLLARAEKGEKPLRISLSGAVLEKRRQSLSARRESRASPAPPAGRPAADLSAFAVSSYDFPLLPFLRPRGNKKR